MICFFYDLYLDLDSLVVIVVGETVSIDESAKLLHSTWIWQDFLWISIDNKLIGSGSPKTWSLDDWEQDFIGKSLNYNYEWNVKKKIDFG